MESLPGSFLKAVGLIQTAPSNCIVFEDPISGIEAAIAAGMTVVGPATTNPIGALFEAGVAIAVNSFEEIELDLLIGWVAR